MVLNGEIPFKIALY